jgi:hypothetical protein
VDSAGTSTNAPFGFRSDCKGYENSVECPSWVKSVAVGPSAFRVKLSLPAHGDFVARPTKTLKRGRPAKNAASQSGLNATLAGQGTRVR